MTYSDKAFFVKCNTADLEPKIALNDDVLIDPERTPTKPDSYVAINTIDGLNIVRHEEVKDKALIIGTAVCTYTSLEPTYT
jgi:hypothetical protein